MEMIGADIVSILLCKRHAAIEDMQLRKVCSVERHANTKDKRSQETCNQKKTACGV